MCNIDSKCVESRRKFMISYEYDDSVYFIALTEEQERLLEYMKNKNLLFSDVVIKPLDETELDCI